MMKQLRVLIAFLIVLAVVPIIVPKAKAATFYVTSDVTSDTTWTTGNTYIVQTNLQISPSATLAIQSGVVVKFDSNYTMIVNGTLIASGDASNMITFTSNNSSPSAGDWRKIIFTLSSDGDNSIINYCRIEYALVGIQVGNVSLQILNNEISNIETNGIDLYQSNSQISYNHITNTRNGVKIYDSPSPIVTNNQISLSLHAIKAYGSNPTIEGNTFEDNTGDAVLLEFSSPSIHNNTFTNNRGGISAQFASNPHIYENTISGSTTTGISCYYFSNATIENNVISNSDTGIYVSDYSVPVINDNQITGAVFGLKLKNHSSPNIENSNLLSISLTAIEVVQNSNPISINTSFEWGKVSVDSSSGFTVKNYLRVGAERANGTSIGGATVKVMDNNKVIYTVQTDGNGLTTSMLLIDRIYEGSSIPIENITIVNVTYDNLLFEVNDRSVNMSSTHTEIFVEAGESLPDNGWVIFGIIGLILAGILILLFLVYRRKVRRKEDEERKKRKGKRKKKDLKKKKSRRSKNQRRKSRKEK